MNMSAPVDVKALRDSLGWTQEKLAEHLGLDRSSVSRLENGQAVKGPTLRLLQALTEEASERSSTIRNTTPDAS